MMNIQKVQVQYKITQSDWINHFAKSIGVGKFLLLELLVPEDHGVSKQWSGVYKKLSKLVAEIETDNQKGELNFTMILARSYFENLKVENPNSGPSKFRDDFIKLLQENNHSAAGIDDFNNAIWKFFDFLSKYLHEKDKQFNDQAIPIANKEDAYFAYALSVGLLNLISRKMRKN